MSAAAPLTNQANSRVTASPSTSLSPLPAQERVSSVTAGSGLTLAAVRVGAVLSTTTTSLVTLSPLSVPSNGVTTHATASPRPK